MKLFSKFENYQFQLRHITIIFGTLIIFQLALSIVNKEALKSFALKTQNWYQKDSAERFANLIATSLELLTDSFKENNNLDERQKLKLINSFNIILNQPMLHQNVDETALIIDKGEGLYVINDGEALLDYLMEEKTNFEKTISINNKAKEIFLKLSKKFKEDEQIYSFPSEKESSFLIFVPFIPRGEYMGALYMKISPDFSFLTREILSSYEEIGLLYLSLIFIGLLTMYFISSYSLKERDEAQKKFFEEHEKRFKEQIEHEKEAAFAKRIYHAHHKAEKIVGFIKEDLIILNEKNIDEIKRRITKYANFISRVIYDMKWYEPPLHTIRGTIFRVNLNEILVFLVENVFNRAEKTNSIYQFNLELDAALPPLSINEYILWEIIEPLIQNCIDHSGAEKTIINITTKADYKERKIYLKIKDNGKGFDASVLELDENGKKQLFNENVSTKLKELSHRGYGCYIAYTIAVERCGWQLDAYNSLEGGAVYELIINF